MIEFSTISRNILTERLALSPLHLNDAEFILKLTNTKEWLQFIGDRNIRSIKDAENYIEKINTTPSIFYWKVKLKDDNSSIGLISLIQRDYLDQPDIGFAFLPNYTKKGFAFEASKHALDILLTEPNINRVLAVTQADNVASIDLLQRLGLSFDSTLTQNTSSVDIYSISKES